MAFTRHGYLISGTTWDEERWSGVVHDCGGPGKCVGCSADSLSNPDYVPKEGKPWFFPPNAIREALGFPPPIPMENPAWKPLRPKLVLIGPESNPDSFISMLRMWLARKMDVGPASGSYWCIGCSLNEGKTFIQYTNDLEVMQQHVRRHGPDAFIRLRSALPGLEI